MKLNIRNGVTVINGRSFQGSSIQVSNGRVVIDGIDQGVESGPSIDVQINGHVESLELEAGTVKADSAGTVKTVSGYVVCGDVSGPVSSVSGDIDAGAISGPVSTISGDVKHR